MRYKLIMIITQLIPEWGSIYLSVMVQLLLLILKQEKLSITNLAATQTKNAGILVLR